MEEIRQSRRRRRLWIAIAVGATLLAAIVIACFSVATRPQFDFVAKYHGRPIDVSKSGSFMLVDSTGIGPFTDYVPEAYEFDFSEATMKEALKHELNAKGPETNPNQMAFVVTRMDKSGRVFKKPPNRSYVFVVRRPPWLDRQWQALKNRITTPPKKATK